MGLEDQQFDEWWVVVDAHLRSHTDLPAKTTQYCNPERPGTFVIGADNLLRWEIKPLPHEDREHLRSELHVCEVSKRFVDLAAIDIWRTTADIGRLRACLLLL